jgi:penicillin G amidase
VPVPGDNDDHEWTGYIPRDELPQLFDPPEGVIATANARVTGPAYKWHLTDQWMAPYRTARIYELLSERDKLTPEDCINIATDIYSYPHVALGRELLKAREHATPKDIRTVQMLEMIPSWSGRFNTDLIQPSFLEFTRRTVLRNLLEPYLGANVERYDWMRGAVFLEKVLRERPARWLPAKFATYDDLLIASADEGMERMNAAAIASRNESESPLWEWGRFNQLRMFHPLGRDGILRTALSIGPMPISGSLYSVKQIGRTYGPVMRFVADLSNFDGSLMNVTTGESGHFLSANYRDQFQAWYDGRGVASAFTDAAAKAGVQHTLRLVPAPEKQAERRTP